MNIAFNSAQAALRRTELLEDDTEASRDRQHSRLYPFRAPLLADLGKLSFGSAARRRIIELSHDPKLGPSARGAVDAVDGAKHWLKISPPGQVTVSISGCPRELKSLLLERARLLPALKLGRSVRYRIEDIERIEAEAEVVR
jgi:hypothetical protein